MNDGAGAKGTRSDLASAPAVDGLGISGASQTSSHPSTTRRTRPHRTTSQPPLPTPPHCSPVRNRTHTRLHAFTMVHKVLFWSGFGNSSTTSAISIEYPTNRGCSSQASLPEYGSSALKCDRSSTKNRSGSTPSMPALAAALATGSWVLSSDNSDSSPTDETHCSKSEHEGRNATRLLPRPHRDAY